MSSRWLLVLLFAVSVGCSSAEKKGDMDASATVVMPTPTPRPPGSYEKLGEIVLVNEVAGFVLVDVGPYIPPDGEALKAFAPEVQPGETGESAVLTVSIERARPFVVADIVSGEPARGDVVYR
jgi:hypothetical protein